MGNESKKPGGKSLIPFSLKMKEEEKELFQDFAKLNNMSMAELLKSGAKELMVSKGYLSKSPALGILEKGLPYHIVRVPETDTDAFKSLTSYLKKRGYELCGDPFKDNAGYKMQLMVLNQQDKKTKGM